MAVTMATRLPTVVRLGPHVLRVEEVPSAELDDDYGRFEPFRLTIKLREGLPPSLAWTVLAHELIEALDELYQLGLQETQIDVLAQGLVQALGPQLGLAGAEAEAEAEAAGEAEGEEA